MPAQPSPGELPQNLVLSRVLMALLALYCTVSCCRLLVGFEARSAAPEAGAGAAAWAGQRL
jgi:hypothetical protein